MLLFVAYLEFFLHMLSGFCHWHAGLSVDRAAQGDPGAADHGIMLIAVPFSQFKVNPWFMG